MKILYTTILVVCCALFTACDMDNYPEGGLITSEQKEGIVELDPSKLSAEINGMFSSISKQWYVFTTSKRADDFGYPGVCFAQDLNGPDVVGPQNDFNWFSASLMYDDRNDTYANPYIRWAVFYFQLRLANDVLETIPESTENQQLLVYRGQAKAVRAFDYLSLVPYYQFKYKGNENKPAVPIVYDNMEATTNNPRASLHEVYEFILKDITEAIELLEGYKRTTKLEIDQQVAYGIRARVNLYMENWAEAAADAEKAMAGYTPYTKEEISKPAFVDAADHNWMWALLISPFNVPDELSTWPSWMSSFTGYGYTAATGNYREINSLLYNKIPDTDVRKGWWVNEKLESKNLENVTWDGVTGNAVATMVNENKLPFTPYTNVKFGQYEYIGNAVSASDWCMMRVEEMILIRAEALAKSGNLALGKTVLTDFIKTYRDPAYESKAVDIATFENEVWFQRRVELWGEGFSMSDIMRLGKPIVRFHEEGKSNFPTNFEFNIAPDNGWLLLRLPQRESNTNAGIINNTGGTRPKAGENSSLRDGVTD